MLKYLHNIIIAFCFLALVGCSSDIKFDAKNAETSSEAMMEALPERDKEAFEDAINNFIEQNQSEIGVLALTVGPDSAIETVFAKLDGMTAKQIIAKYGKK